MIPTATAKNKSTRQYNKRPRFILSRSLLASSLRVQRPWHWQAQLGGVGSLAEAYCVNVRCIPFDDAFLMDEVEGRFVRDGTADGITGRLSIQTTALARVPLRRLGGFQPIISVHLVGNRHHRPPPSVFPHRQNRNGLPYYRRGHSRSFFQLPSAGGVGPGNHRVQPV